MSAMRGGLLIFLAFLLCLASGQAGTPGAHFVDIRWVEARTASIELPRGKAPIVLLPISLKKVIVDKFSRYRVPEERDYTGDWERYYDYLSPEEVEGKIHLSPERIKQQKVPFVSLGDFNHDMVQDVALLLISKKQPDQWKLVVFQGQAASNQYRPVVLRSSDRDDLKTPVQFFGISRKENCGTGGECLALYRHEAFGYEYIWREGKYKEVTTE